MQSRPWVDEHDKMFRWHDHWLRGIDGGIMDEPAVEVHVEGRRRRITGSRWPVRPVDDRPLCLRTRGRLAFEPDPTAPTSPTPRASIRPR